MVRLPADRYDELMAVCRTCGLPNPSSTGLCLPCQLKHSLEALREATAPANSQSRATPRSVTAALSSRPLQRKQVSSAQGVIGRGPEMLQQKRELRVKCTLCGKRISEKLMGEHLALVHPKRAISGSRPKHPTWIHFVQGGLPGLGKRR